MRWFNRQGVQAAALILLVFGPYATVNGQRVVRLPNLETEQSYDQSADVAHLSSGLRTRWRLARLPEDPTSGTAVKSVTTQSKLQRLLIDWSDALTDDSSFAAVSPASPLQRKLTRFPPDPEFETETVMLASKPQRLPVDPASEGTVSDELNLGDKLVAEVSPDAETYPISFPSTRPYSKCLSPSQ